MSNVHFQRKIISEELWDTLFFATGEYPQKEKTPDYRTLECGNFHVKIYNARRIVVNGEKCSSSSEAKFVICENL
jgi:hypothetical protein